MRKIIPNWIITGMIVCIPCLGDHYSGLSLGSSVILSNKMYREIITIAKYLKIDSIQIIKGFRFIKTCLHFFAKNEKKSSSLFNI